MLRSATEVGGITAVSHGEMLHVGLGYDVTDRVTVGAEYIAAYHVPELDRPLLAYAKVALVHDARLDVVAGGNVAIDAGGSGTEPRVLAQLGVGARFWLAPTLAVFAGGPGDGFGPFSLGAGRGPGAPGPAGQELAIGIGGGTPIALELPAGATAHVGPVEVGVRTTLARISLHHDRDALLGADVVPIDVASSVVVRPDLQLGLYVDVPDLKRSDSQLVVVGIAARYTR